MKNYELTYLISSELSEEEAKTFSQKIASLIQEEGGVLAEKSLPLRKKLAYPVKKQGQAYLTVLVFQLNPEKIANLEKNLKSENQILRYLILTKKKWRIVPKGIRIPPLLKKPRLAIPEKPTVRPKEKKVELKEIEKKLEEILEE